MFLERSGQNSGCVGRRESRFIRPHPAKLLIWNILSSDVAVNHFLLSRIAKLDNYIPNLLRKARVGNQLRKETFFLCQPVNVAQSDYGVCSEGCEDSVIGRSYGCRRQCRWV